MNNYMKSWHSTSLSALIVLSITLLTLIVSCQTTQSYEDIDPSLPNSYVAHYTKKAPQIDGKIDSLEWGSVKWSEAFGDIQSDISPKYETKLKMIWDYDHLYILANLYDEHIWGNLKRRDTVIFYNNDFEVFIDHNGDTHNYAELEVNALNTVWDLLIDKPYLNGAKVDNDWNIDGLVSNVHIEGTLNDFSDLDQFWTLEMAIPWKSLERMEFDGLAPEEKVWRMNFSRVQWQFDTINGHYSRKKDSIGNFLKEDNWAWSKQIDINMHKPEYWGFVLFSKDSTKTIYEVPKDFSMVKWMYENFRKKSFKTLLEQGVYKTGIIGDHLIELNHVIIEGKRFLEFTSPISNIKYSVAEDGKLSMSGNKKD